MNLFFADASALAKRYVPESGSALMHLLYRRVPHSRLACLLHGAGEVIAVLVRRRNAGDVGRRQFDQAVNDFRNEIVGSADLAAVQPSRQQVVESWALIEQHSINSTDALVLRVALDRAEELRENGDDLVLVASDERLLRAAEAEGLSTFDPEVGTESDLESLMS